MSHGDKKDEDYFYVCFVTGSASPSSLPQFPNRAKEPEQAEEGEGEDASPPDAAASAEGEGEGEGGEGAAAAEPPKKKKKRVIPKVDGSWGYYHWRPGEEPNEYLGVIPSKKRRDKMNIVLTLLSENEAKKDDDLVDAVFIMPKCHPQLPKTRKLHVPFVRPMVKDASDLTLGGILTTMLFHMWKHDVTKLKKRIRKMRKEKEESEYDSIKLNGDCDDLKRAIKEGVEALRKAQSEKEVLDRLREKDKGVIVQLEKQVEAAKGDAERVEVELGKKQSELEIKDIGSVRGPGNSGPPSEWDRPGRARPIPTLSQSEGRPGRRISAHPLLVFLEGCGCSGGALVRADLEGSVILSSFGVL